MTKRSPLLASRSLLLTTAGLGLAIVFLIVVASASAQVVVNQSIDRIKLGASMESVRHQLGRPKYVAHCSVFTVCAPVPGAFPGTVSWTYGSSQNQSTSYVFINRRVALMGTFSPSERTAAGVGPGSSRKLTKERYPALAYHHFLPGQQPSGYYITAVPGKTGDVFTILFFAHGRITWLEIGRWNNSPKYVCDFSICS